MVSLLIESFGNNIKTKGALADNSKIKQLLQILIEDKIDNLNKLYSLRCNLNFAEFKSDLLTKMKNTKGTLYSLDKRGYKQTTSDKYNFENLNNIFDYKYIDFIKQDKDSFISNLTLKSKENIKEYTFFFQEDYLIFIPTVSNSSVEYYYKLNGYEILDFKIDKSLFVYLVVKKDKKIFLAISHLGKCFSKYNTDDSTLILEECYNFIDLSKLPSQVVTLEYIKNNNFYFVDENAQILEVNLCKKYYFVDQEFIYFNNLGDFDEFKDLFIDTIQNNFLNMYNYINFLGLNDFKIKGRKISTKENDTFLEIFKNKFDNTLNGGLNYFNAKKINTKNVSDKVREMYNSKKDYHINVNDEYYSIKGNFVYDNFSKGDFKIEITEKYATLFKFKDNIPTLVYKVEIPTYKEFYFCNLKFTFKKFEFPLEPYSLFLSSNSPYLFKQSIVKNYKIETIPNNARTINNFAELTSDPNIDTNIEFDGKKIIFYNYFDWKSKKYKYGHLEKKLTIGEIVDIKTMKKFVCFNDYIIKNNKFYSREFGNLLYTKTDSFKYELINSNGYITPFWIENQDKIIYFKNNNNSVSIINNKYESDFYAYIPNIKNYIRYNNKMYSNVSVNINDDLDIELKNNPNVLITNKFFEEPLFYKIYIENNDLDNIHIFDNDNNEISELLYEKFNSGYIFYFNIEKGKKYYYNTKESKYNYFDAIESYKNIDFIYRFDEIGYINLNDVKHFNTFTLKSNKIIEKNVTFSLFLYNTITGETNKFSLTNEELNNKFEIDLNINKIYIDIDNKEYSKDMFYIVDDSNNSLVNDDSIIFFKNDRKDIVYIAEKNLDIDISKIDLTKIKVNTYYKINDYKNIIETIDGSFIIDSFNKNEIAIVHNNNEKKYFSVDMFLTESLGDGNDTFYRKNFKMPGGVYINHDINSKKIAEMINTKVSTDEIFITTSNGGPNE